jgi:hypothetical protein
MRLRWRFALIGRGKAWKKHEKSEKKEKQEGLSSHNAA